MKTIRSESQFIWKFLFQIIITPFTLLMVFLKKRTIKDLLKPFISLFDFIFEAKFTFTIIIMNIIFFIISFIFLTENQFMSLVSYPIDLINLRLHTLITSGFMHANLAHLLGNILGIFIFGRVVEKRLGVGKTVLIYFGSLIISGIFSSLINLFITGNNVGGIGASGALMGLISTAILLDPFYFTYELIIPLPIMVVGWLAIFADILGILNPVESGIGHLAHIGGFISIALLMYFFGEEKKNKIKQGFIINIISLFLFLGLYLLFF
jgi:membrane associated rhomboid family serine protease